MDDYVFSGNPVTVDPAQAKTTLDIVYAPFTPEQVTSLNDYQRSGVCHPFTCGKNSSFVLVAAAEGWHCAACGWPTALGWTIMHPLVGCGLDLFDCPVNEAAERGVARPDRYARYRCDVDDEGRLVVGEEVSGA